MCIRDWCTPSFLLQKQPNKACCDVLEAMGQRRHIISADLLDILVTRLQLQIQNTLEHPLTDEDADPDALEER